MERKWSFAPFATITATTAEVLLGVALTMVLLSYVLDAKALDMSYAQCVTNIKTQVASTVHTAERFATVRRQTKN